MDRLPQEIIDRIVFFLPGNKEKPPSRAKYATISLKFRAAIERGTFNTLWVNSENVETFEQVLRPWRRPYVAYLYYHVHLPACDPALVKRVERPADTERVSRDLSLDLGRLFQILNRLDGMAGVSLDLLGVEHLQSRERWTLGSCRYRIPRARLNLLGSYSLPNLNCIRSLDMTWERPAAPHVYIELASRLEGLSTLSFQLDTTEMRYPGRLRADRNDLASSLETFSESTQSIPEAELKMGLGVHVSYQMLPMPNLIYPLGYDRLGSSLRTWSQRLVKCSVHGVFDGTLFWPHALEKDAPTPEWPKMEEFDVRLERHTPAGWWYFMPKGKPKYGTLPRDPAQDPYDQPPTLTEDFENSIELEWIFHDDSWGYPDAEGGVASDPGHEWVEEFDPLDRTPEEHWNLLKYGPQECKLARNVPNEEEMYPLLESWAKAIGCMPSLRTAQLSFEVEFPMENRRPYNSLVDWEVKYESLFHWRVRYEAPGSRDSRWPEDDGLGQRRLFLECMHGWRPSKHIMDILQRLGEDSHPNTDMVVWEADSRYKVERHDNGGSAYRLVWTRNEWRWKEEQR